MTRMGKVGVALAATLASGCTDATGTVRGGELLLVDQTMNAACAADAGDTWTSLYGCYFGPTGKASCAALPECHGLATGLGGSFGFVCGPTQESCYEGFTHFPFGSDAGAALSAGTIRRNYLRAPGNLGTMPCNPSSGAVICSPSDPGNAYAFTRDDIARIDAWIDGGAQNN